MVTKRYFACLAFALAALWAVGGLSVALHAGAVAAAVKAQRIVHNTANYEITVRYPQMGMKAIDDQIADWAKNYAAGFAADTASKPADERAWNADVSYKVTRNDAEMFEVLFTLYTFTGGAHPNTELVSLNFLVSDGYQVDLSDIVGRGGIAKVSELAIANLIHEIGSGSTEPMTSTTKSKKAPVPAPTILPSSPSPGPHWFFISMNTRSRPMPPGRRRRASRCRNSRASSAPIGEHRCLRSIARRRPRRSRRRSVRTRRCPSSIATWRRRSGCGWHGFPRTRPRSPTCA